MTMTMWEQCQLIKLTSEQFEAGRQQMPRPAPKGSVIVIVEPWLAQVIQEIEHHNRPKKPHMIHKVKSALLGQYWCPNGEVIILDENMTLLDGDNRLTACREAQLPLETIITWGWPREGFLTIDIGTKRSGGDTLSAAGYANAYALSAAAHYDSRLATHNMATDVNLADALIEGYIKEHGGLMTSLSWGDVVGKFIPKGLAVALHYRLSMQDAARAKQFFLEIAHGEDINRHHTTYWLREVLSGYRKPHLHLTRTEQAHIAANVLKGWHAVCAGRLRQRADLLWHPARHEPFPELVYAQKQKQPPARKREVSAPTLL